jgi:hypothetical protein
MRLSGSGGAAAEPGDRPVSPAVITVGDTAGRSAIDVIEQIRTCIRTALDVMQHARAEGAQVRNAKLLLQPTEVLRRCLETATRLYEAVAAVQRIDQFNAKLLEVVEAVHAECPGVARLIIQRTRAVADRCMSAETAAGRTHARVLIWARPWS